jgi:5-methylcytosine-specific restriction endonuclease McrA
MIKINKKKEPVTLGNYRSSIPKKKLLGDKIYDDFRYKSKEGCETKEYGNLRRQLLEEQGFVCCYCLTQVSCKNSKIEHFKPQSKYS